MNRSEIASFLRYLIEDGRLKSKKGTGLSYPAINKAIAEGRLFQTSFASVVCTDGTARDKFEDLVGQGRIIDGTGMKVRGYLTLYAQTKAAADGKVLRFPDLGNASVLYID